MMFLSYLVQGRVGNSCIYISFIFFSKYFFKKYWNYIGFKGNIYC